MIDFEKTKKIYFIGIGGIMMSAVARFFIERGVEVSGSDREMSEITDKLEKIGASVVKGHSVANLTNEFDLVITTEAIELDNPELIRANDLKLPVFTVYQILGELSKDKYTIAVAGMHGKSTSSSMMGLLLEAAGLDPTIFIGTQLKEYDGNFRMGKSEYIVSEACEYRDNFLNYYPSIGVITNIEAEHLDYFKNITGVKKSFKTFASQIKEDGWLVYNGDDKNTKNVARGCRANKISFGVEADGLDFRAENIEVGEDGNVRFEIKSKKLKEFDGIRFSLKVPGKFNVYNALSVIAVAAILEIKIQIIQEVLSKFSGVWRRFEFRGESEGISYYDDYAHHPTEIKATLQAVKEKFGNKKVWIIYQPHLYSRTNDFMGEFAESLNLAENLLIAPIYAAREDNKWGIENSDLVVLMNKKYKRVSKVKSFSSFELIRKYLKENVASGEVVMTMGAGDVFKVVEME
jgi:UDP-N-acetylmuramate--alanine ligase